jgi:ribosome biogenesis protein Nip4
MKSKYDLLSREELGLVEAKIKQLLNSDITPIFAGKQLIKIKGRREEIYLVSHEKLSLLDHFSSQLPEEMFSIEHAQLKLGFFIQKNFLIGIESLTFLAPHTRRKIQLDADNTIKFIFGKDVEIDTISIKKQIEHLNEDVTIMVFSNTGIPLGYAEIISDGTEVWLKNLVDIGIFLRSEKSAF